MKRSAQEIVKDYAFMTAKPFNYRQVMQDLGLARRTAHNAISKLAKAGDITLISTSREGIYRIATTKQKKAAHAKKLAESAEDMRINGDEYHQILSEVL